MSEKQNKKQDFQQLIADCISNKRVAQQKLFKTFYSKLFNICYRYADNYEDAQDMLNEGFIKIFANLEKYEPNGSFEGWMKRIMANAAVDFQRKYHSHNDMLSVEDLPYVSMNLYDENNALAKLSNDELLQLIQKLPPTSRMVFNLYVFENYSHAEISSMLNMKEGTSHWHLNFARNKLKMMILAQ